MRLIIDLTCHDCQTRGVSAGKQERERERERERVRSKGASRSSGLYESELVGAPVRYLQLATPAKQFVDRALIHRIAREITELWASEPDAYVAMHCSYGFNRTGFVIVSYLVEFGGLDIEEALAIFEQSRPPSPQRPTDRSSNST